MSHPLRPRTGSSRTSPAACEKTAACAPKQPPLKVAKASPTEPEPTKHQDLEKKPDQDREIILGQTDNDKDRDNARDKADSNAHDKGLLHEGRTEDFEHKHF